jgi:hypothetical protein
VALFAWMFEFVQLGLLSSFVSVPPCRAVPCRPVRAVPGVPITALEYPEPFVVCIDRRCALKPTAHPLALLPQAVRTYSRRPVSDAVIVQCESERAVRPVEGIVARPSHCGRSANELVLQRSTLRRALTAPDRPSIIRAFRLFAQLQ